MSDEQTVGQYQGQLSEQTLAGRLDHQMDLQIKWQQAIKTSSLKTTASI